MEKPKKKIEISNQRTYPFCYASNKVLLDVFLKWVKDSVPNNATDVCIGLVEDNNEGDCFYHISYIEISWKEMIDNVNYDKQMKKYNKYLERQSK